MKRILIFYFTLIFMAAALLCLPAYAKENGTEPEEEDPKLYAQSAVLLDAASGRVLYGKNETLIRPMASTTKIMTCILALELGNSEDEVTASKTAAGQPKVHLGVNSGQTFYLKDLLYSLMLESHNDTAVMIAEHIGGSVEGFAKLMNDKARELGCEDTYFITPNGLDASVTDGSGAQIAHSTTAVDLGRIMSYCVTESPKKDEFLKVTQTQNYYFTDIPGKRGYNCTNHNAFLTMMPGMISGKTGFTGGAGYSYVGALADQDRLFVISLLGCGWPPHKTYKWSDARALFRYGLDNYQYQEVFKLPELKQMEVEKGVPTGKTGETEETAYTGLTLNLGREQQSLKVLMREDEKVKVVLELKKKLTAPVEKGEQAGRVIYYLDGEILKIYPVFTSESVEKRSFGWCIRKIADQYFSIPGIAL